MAQIPLAAAALPPEIFFVTFYKLKTFAIIYLVWFVPVPPTGPELGAGTSDPDLEPHDLTRDCFTVGAPQERMLIDSLESWMHGVQQELDASKELVKQRLIWEVFA